MKPGLMRFERTRGLTTLLGDDELPYLCYQGRRVQTSSRKFSSNAGLAW